MIRSALLPDKQRLALLEAFSRLPQRVLWKWEEESMPGQPANVMVRKWLPQQEVLRKTYHVNKFLKLSIGFLGNH